MLKKVLCLLFTLLILIVFSVLPASAAETVTTPSVNQWTLSSWQSFFGGKNINESGDYDDFANDYFKSLGKSVNDSIAYLDRIQSDGKPQAIAIYVTDGTFKLSNVDLNSKSAVKVDVVGSTYISRLVLWFNGQVLTTTMSESLLTGFNFVYSDFSDVDTSDCTTYLCANVYQSFLNYLNAVDLDLNPIVPPDGFNKTAIKYSDYGDCPYSKYGIKPYEVDTENYVTSGLFSDLDIYYDSYFDFNSSYDHLETIDFYVKIDCDKDCDCFDDEENLYKDYLKGEKPDFSNFFNNHFRAVHYENDIFSVLDFFNNAYGGKYSSINDFVSLEKIGGRVYIKFSLKSEYSITHTGVGVEPGSSNLTNKGTIFAGHRVTHTCKHIDPKTGDIGGSGDGLGSDISQADDTMSRPPTKKELEDLGFEHGYPNTSGNYPYKVTIYRNGVEYFQMFFSSMPSVTSTYYTDKCIDYGVNVYNKKIYMYFKEQNMSKSFDFTSKNNFDELVEDGSFYDQVMFTPISKEYEKVLNTILNIDTSEFNNTYTLHMWTNYTGEFDNMNGFYCKFNWDLEKSGHFQKNNSDDNYDYSKDYDPDKGFTDNNGNTHGGAVETPTEDPSYNGFNNSDFTFDENTLWDYADSFLAFCTRAFKCLPNFIWQLIGCSIVVVIILRIVGR